MATSSSAPFHAGDVVVVPFPYSDRLAQKRRPALVVSNDDLHALGLIWAVMITSAKSSSHPRDFVLSDLARAGRKPPSIIRPSKIACLEPSRILRVAGTVSEVETTETRYAPVRDRFWKSAAEDRAG
jgi:mRNA interferase MazF